MLDRVRLSASQPAAHPDHQQAGTDQLGDQTAYPSDRDLSTPVILSTAGEGGIDGNQKGLGKRQDLMDVGSD